MESPDTIINKYLDGYRPTCVIAAATSLGVFDALAGSPLTAQSVAEKLRLSVKGTERLLNALCALGIAAKNGAVYDLPNSWRDYLTRDGKHSMSKWIRLIDNFMPLWVRLPEFVREGRNLTSIMEMLGGDPEKMRDFTDAMHDKALKSPWLIAREIPFDGYSHLLDIGGGPGTYSLELARLYSKLRATIFDIAPVTEVAKQYIARYNLSQRVDTRAGDFFKDEFEPGKYDVILIANVLHMYDPETARTLARKAARALPDGGRIVIHGFCTDAGETGPLADVLFSLNIGMLMPGGRAHPVPEKIRWLEECGIGDIRHFRIDALPTGVVTGVKK